MPRRLKQVKFRMCMCANRQVLIGPFHFCSSGTTILEHRLKVLTSLPPFLVSTRRCNVINCSLFSVTRFKYFSAERSHF